VRPLWLILYSNKATTANTSEESQGFHLTANYELPILPPELLFKSFISKTEEHDMGVPNEKTKDWRVSHHMPDTDFYMEWEIEQSRKRAGSILSLESSQSSTKSR